MALSADYRDLITGGLLQAACSATIGQPLEIIKTRQGAHPTEALLTSFNHIAQSGYGSFWRGLDAKIMESGLKGSVLFFSREMFSNALTKSTLFPCPRDSPTNGVVSGFCAGLCQTVFVAPFTFIVTYRVANAQKSGTPTWKLFQEVGLRGAYSGASAVAGRQATNWALRGGLSNVAISQYKKVKCHFANKRLAIGGSSSAPAATPLQSKDMKLNSLEYVGCAMVGGALAAINQPFEVVRIRMQAARAQTTMTQAHVASRTFFGASGAVYKEAGLRGFYAGIIPRICYSAYQSVFMIAFAAIAKEHVAKIM